MSTDPANGQLHTLGLLERLHAEASAAEGTYSDLYDRVDTRGRATWQKAKAPRVVHGDDEG
jgi:hypothetical protein